MKITMTPEALKAFIKQRIENLCIIRDFLILPTWHWFDNKKTTLGACFFFIQAWVIIPYYDKVVHTTPPEELTYAMSVIAAFFTVLGVTHKGVRMVTNRIRNGGPNGKDTPTSISSVID